MTKRKNCDAFGVASEMAIVDIFTKLIFGEEGQFSESELHIIEVLRRIDSNVTFDVHCDMGTYLRALGVREMIILVGEVRGAMEESVAQVPPAGRPSAGHRLKAQ